MREDLKKEFLRLVKTLEQRPTKAVATNEIRDKFKAYLDGTEDSNVLVMDHGRPRAVVLNYETYNALTHLARLITFEVIGEEDFPVSDDKLKEMEAKREARRTRRAQSKREGRQSDNAALAHN